MLGAPSQWMAFGCTLLVIACFIMYASLIQYSQCNDDCPIDEIDKEELTFVEIVMPKSSSPLSLYAKKTDGMTYSIMLGGEDATIPLVPSIPIIGSKEFLYSDNNLTYVGNATIMTKAQYHFTCTSNMWQTLGFSFMKTNATGGKEFIFPGTPIVQIPEVGEFVPVSMFELIELNPGDSLALSLNTYRAAGLFRISFFQLYVESV